MKIEGTEMLRGDGFVLRPITEEDAQLMVAASTGDIPDWTFIPRDLDQDAAQAWIRRGQDSKRNGRAIRFVIELPECKGRICPAGQGSAVGLVIPCTDHDRLTGTGYSSQHVNHTSLRIVSS